MFVKDFQTIKRKSIYVFVFNKSVKNLVTGKMLDISTNTVTSLKKRYFDGN